MRVIDEQIEITGEESGLIRQIDRRWLMSLSSPARVDHFIQFVNSCLDLLISVFISLFIYLSIAFLI